MSDTPDIPMPANPQEGRQRGVMAGPVTLREMVQMVRDSIVCPEKATDADVVLILFTAWQEMHDSDKGSAEVEECGHGFVASECPDCATYGTPDEPLLGTCENLAHDSKPQEWHERNATCIDWHPGADRPDSEVEMARLRRIEAAAVAVQIERNGWDGSLEIKGGNEAVEALRLAVAGVEADLTVGWWPMDKAPHDGTVILGDYGWQDGIQMIRWAESRRCMLEGAGGTFGPGWEDVENRLIADEPSMWRHLTGEEHSTLLPTEGTINE